MGDGKVGNWRRQFVSAAQLMLDLVFPPRCVFCDVSLSTPDSGPVLCHDCTTELLAPRVPACARCGASLPLAAAEDPSDAEIGCHVCHKKSYRFDRVITLGSYRESLREAVLRIKSSREEPLAHTMAELLWCYEGRQISELNIDAVVPVPMHWRRRIRRGVNSPETLAARLAGHVRVPIDRRMLVRVRNTLPQGQLPNSRRAANVRHAFRLSAGYDLKDARLLLVDDILTTGATVNEAARTLKQAGADYVGVVVIARAVRTD